MKRILNALSKLNCGKWMLAVLMSCGTSAVVLPAQTFTTLYSFCPNNSCASGATPRGALVQGTDGNLYGTTFSGGNGGGTVYRITPGGKVKTLYSFGGGADYPYDPLILATNGKFYGTTSHGGYGGTVFEMTPGGTFTELYGFCSQGGTCADGSGPEAGLFQAANGAFYGTTAGGGVHQGGGVYQGGTVFEITPRGNLTTLYSFCAQSGCADGAFPVAGLVQTRNGNLYGTTQVGGVNGPCGDGAAGCGTVFQITPTGALTTLHSFCPQNDCLDGAIPYAGLVVGTDGNLYGTTGDGGSGIYGVNNGAGNGGGTVFKITPKGALTTLYNFCSQVECADGGYPVTGLIQGTDGNFYGITTQGGADNLCGGISGCGTVFQVTASGALTTLYSFCSQPACADGFQPIGALVQGTDGSFYGTTALGGAADSRGTVFSLSVGLGPFVKTLPSSGKVGAAVKILGTTLTGSTSVTFNGTAATFTVVSASEITTTVPVGAATGTVQVVTPTATLSSNVPFEVP